MLCYVGKATKIFLFLVAALVAVGFFVTIGLHHHSWAHKARPTCQGGGGGQYCSPVASFPDPATAASVPPSLVDPTTGGTAATSPPPPSISASMPPTSPYPTTGGTAATPPPLPSPLMPFPPPFLNPPTDVPAGSIVAAPPPVFSPPSPVTAAPGPGQA